MYAVLRLEVIGDNFDAYGREANRRAKAMGIDLGYKSNQPWVARITGKDARYGLARTFLQGQKDYSLANSVGSRGIYLYFSLKDGIYEVKEHVSWKRDRRYFLLVHQAAYHEISREEVERHLESVAQAPDQGQASQP